MLPRIKGGGGGDRAGVSNSGRGSVRTGPVRWAGAWRLFQKRGY